MGTGPDAGDLDNARDAGGHRVIVTDRCVETFDGQPLTSRIERGFPVIAQYQVVAATDADGILCGSTEHNVSACACCDGVVATVDGVDRRNLLDGNRLDCRRPVQGRAGHLD